MSDNKVKHKDQMPGSALAGTDDGDEPLLEEQHSDSNSNKPEKKSNSKPYSDYDDEYKKPKKSSSSSYGDEYRTGGTLDKEGSVHVRESEAPL